MAMAIVRLFERDGTRVEIVGDQPTNTNDDVTIQKLVITRPTEAVTLTLLSAQPPTGKIPRGFLQPVGATVPPVFECVRGANEFVLQAMWAFDVASSKSFFGLELSAEAGIAVGLSLTIPSLGSTNRPPYLVLVARGQIVLQAGPPQVLSAVAIGVRVVIDEFPTAPVFPALELELPGDIPWPKLRLPWSSFPKIPSWPWRLPAYAFSLPALPLRVGWKAVEITLDLASGNLRVHVEQLEIIGIGSTITVSLDIVFKRNPATGEVTIKLENIVLSGLEPLNNLQLRQLSPGCFGFDWSVPAGSRKGVQPLLRLLSQELTEITDSDALEVRLRIHASNREVEEIRLDWWWPVAGSRDLRLPGFEVSFPQPEMISLIARRELSADDNDEMRLTLVATYPAGKDIHAKTTFSWPIDGRERELLRDGDGNNSDSLITLKVTSRQPVSLVLFDLPLSGQGAPPRFVQQLDTPLSPLLEQETSAGGEENDEQIKGLFDPCPPTTTDLVKLRADDWSLDLDFNVPFKLPFLNLGDSQFISVKLLSKNLTADFEFECVFEITVKIGEGLQFTTQATAVFDPQRMGFRVHADQGLTFVAPDDVSGDFLGLHWEIAGKPDNDPQKRDAFILVLQNNNYQLRQAPGAEIVLSYARATSKERPIKFRVTDFALTPKGVNLVARVTDDPARLNGLETQFRFTEGVLKITENRIAGFTIAGTGPLPPALVGDAVADIALQFEQRDGDKLKLVAGGAQIKGSKLLSCKASRFEFELDGLGLKFVDDDGGDHLYFTLSGKARYKSLASDDSSGPLSWLPKIEIQLVECPLTGNMRVIARHVRFMIDLPKKLKFDFLGCFQMELRGIGFLPQFDGFGDDTSAMQLSGQIMFADGGGDVMETKIDFHNLYVALPEPGSFIPRIHLKGLTIHMKQGESFRLYGSLAFFDGEDVEPGIPAKGFTGEGEVSIQGLPTMAASFAFLRVSPDAKKTWKRAWFIYLEARELSLKVPVIEIALREVGLGFGYRYTLASFKAIDNIQDPKKLLKELKRLARTQGNLSKRDQWRVDLEAPGEDTRWTIVLRALFSQVSAQAGPWGDYNRIVEQQLSCLFVMDVVIALRSDLTFFMAGRAWLNTNYADFNTPDSSLRDHPLFAAFVMLSPRQKRFLANLSSQPDAEFGDHPPLPGFLKEAIRSCRYSATLLIEPGLVHYELGWPNQLQWRAKLGPLEAEFRGGTIFRVSETEMVIGNSFLARGKLELKAEISAGFFGASLYALAQVAYGARYIGVLAFKDTVANSAFYGAVGVDIRVAVKIAFWIEIELILTSIRLDFSFSFALTFTASLEVGITLTDAIGLHGTATVGLEIMGHNLHFDVRVGLNDEAVHQARQRTERFLHIGLESEDVEAVPGTDRTALNAPVPAGGGAHPHALLPPAALAGAAPNAAIVLPAGEFHIPNYSLTSAFVRRPVKTLAGNEERHGYYLLIPAADPDRPGYYAVPPTDPAQVVHDYSWEIGTLPPNVSLAHFVPLQTGGGWIDVVAGTHSWKVDWAYRIDIENLKGGSAANETELCNLLRHAYRVDDPTKPFGTATPESDPQFGGLKSESLSDERVLNPTATAFESAVRGAALQFAAPYFKFDPNSDYDRKLKEAFKPETSIYSDEGKLPGGKADSDAQQEKRATQLRSAVLQAIIRDFHRYAELVELGDSGKSERETLEGKSLAFRLGMVFRATIPATQDPSGLRWLEERADAGKFLQRKGTASLIPDSEDRTVTLFHKFSDSFLARTPRFVKVRKYEHANTIALHWELQWPETDSGMSPSHSPEHFLRYYKVRRVHLDGNDPEVEYTLKPSSVLHREKTQQDDGSEVEQLVRLLPRFPLVDHFDGEVEADVSALTEDGKTYLYTIIPVDLEGNDSPRPLTIVASRFPADPPLVPTDGELIVDHAIDRDFTNLVTKTSNDELVAGARPLLMADKDLLVRFRWTPPIEPDNRPSGPIQSYALVFRREPTLPIGFFGADQETRGQVHNGYPVTNARRLRNDLVIPFMKPVAPSDPRYVVALDRATLIAAGILPPGSSNLRKWRPEAWRVFVQTTTPSSARHPGVSSALAPVTITSRYLRRSDFENLTATPSIEPLPAVIEHRKSILLEWVPKPVRFDLLPPWDQSGTSGFAKVPMPTLSAPENWKYPLNPADSAVNRLTFEQHPDRLRAIEFRWNQGPSEPSDHPLALHARYDLYEFDCDAHTGERLEMNTLDPINDPTGSADKLVDFQKFERRGGLRRIQAIELLPTADLPLAPADTLTPQAWEAWYPGLSRRLSLRRQLMNANKWPKKSERSLGPWYSWRESFLEWPDPDMPVGQNQAALPGLFDDKTQRVWPYHSFLRAILSRIVSEMGSDGFPKYTVELQPLPARASGDDANAHPPRPTGIEGLLTDTSPATDPYGWSMLQRMGLSIAFRVRQRQTGEYVVGQDLQNLVQKHLKGAIEFFKLPDDHLRFLHVEHLLQPGQRTRIAAREDQSAGAPKAEQLLALMQISLRPAVRQRLRYRSVRISSKKDADGAIQVPVGTDVEIELKCSTDEASYLVASGSPGSPNGLENSATPLQLTETLPSDGILVLLLRAVDPSQVTVTAKSNVNGSVFELDVQADWMSPIDWRCLAFTALDKAPGEAISGPAQQHWNFLCRYLSRALRPISANPSIEPNADEVSRSLLKSRSAALDWLDRFFGTGGDVTPNDGSVTAKTEPGPWLASAYPRALTPLALTPENGRLTYRHLIEDQWAHAYRYLIRPRGRYDLLWAAIGDAREKIEVAPKFLFANQPGRLGAAQRWSKIPDESDIGGTDIVLQRIRSLAPPLVLSSRRLDRFAPPGQAVPPGAIWEVLLAKHPEQTLIENNRSLLNHLAYRQQSHAMFRRLTLTGNAAGQGDVIADWRKLGQQVVSGLYENQNSPIATTPVSKLWLIRGANTVEIGLANSRLIDVKNALPADLNPEISPCDGVGVQLILKPLAAASVYPLELRTVETDPMSNLLSRAMDWRAERFESATGALIGRYQTQVFVAKTDPILPASSTDLRMELAVYQPSGAGTDNISRVSHELALAENTVDAVVPALQSAMQKAVASDVRILGLLREETGGGFRIVLTAEQPVARVELRSVSGDPDSNRVEFVREEPGLPSIPSRLDHLDLDKLNDDEANSLDLPLRSTRFSQGAVALQFQSLPYYYEHKLLVIAQSSHVVSPITEVTHRDFEYVAPEPSAVMEGISSTTANGTAGPRQRRIAIRLERYWDCLPWGTRHRHQTENPASVTDRSKRRQASLPDKDVIYQVVVKMPSGNVEVLAEYLFEMTEVSGYKSRKLEGPFEGIAVRQLPNGESDPELDRIDLETLLKPRATAGGESLSWQTVTSRFAFEAQRDLLYTFADVASNPGGTEAEKAEILRHAPSACVWQRDGTSDLQPDEEQELRALLPKCDTALASGLRSLLAQSGPRRHALVSIGLEQLQEIAEDPSKVRLPAFPLNPVARKKISWQGVLSAAQEVVWEHWLKSTPFAETLRRLREAIRGDSIQKTYPDDPANPTQADTTIPVTRLKVEVGQLSWMGAAATPPTAAELTDLTALKVGRPQAVIDAIDDLLIDLADPLPRPTVDIVETDWQPRPDQTALPSALRGRIQVSNGLIGFAGLMLRDEARALLAIAGLPSVDRQAIRRLLTESLQSGLNGGRLEIRARRGSADPVSREISAEWT